MKNEIKNVRLQIPVSRALADKLAEHARNAERSQGWAAAKILRISIDELRVFGRWMGKKITAREKSKRATSLLQLGDNSEVRLQIMVTEKVSNTIDEISRRLNHTPVRMAALLLDFGLEEYHGIFRAMGSVPGRAISRALGYKPQPYESAETDDD